LSISHFSFLVFYVFFLFLASELVWHVIFCVGRPPRN
jgi:hypothetical protein